MNRLTVCAALALLIAASATPSSASVIYKFRETGSKTVLAWLKFAEPPASATSGWHTSDPGDLLEFFCLCLVVGNGSVLPPGSTLDVDVTSFDGTQLDFGLVTGSFSIPPVNPGDPTIKGGFNISFGHLPGEDDINGLAVYYFPDGQELIAELLPTDGNFTVVPEPATLTLLGVGAVATAWRRHRRHKEVGRGLS